MKHAAMAFSSVAFSLNLLLAGVVAAQSAPPRKDIPAIAKAANGVVVSIITSDKDGHARCPRHWLPREQGWPHRDELPRHQGCQLRNR